MPIARSVVLGQLETYGTKIADMNQGARIESTLERGYTDDGFCRGVCLDWMRRVLLGGNSHYNPKGTKSDPQKADTEARQTLRMAKAQKTMKAHTDVGVSQITARNSKIVNLVGYLVPIYNDARGNTEFPPGAMRQLREFYNLTSNILSKETLGQIIDELNEEVVANNRAIEEHRERGQFPAAWRGFVEVMDDYVTRMRAEAGKEGSARRTFNAIEIVTSSGQRQYANPSAAASAVTGNGALSVDRGALMGIEILVGARTSGHAVAFKRVSESRYHFIDPNYGVFDVNQGGVHNAVNYLFATVYQQDGWRMTSKAHYAIFKAAEG